MISLLLVAQVSLPQAGPRALKPPPPPPPPPPNILIVLVDDIGVDQVGCYAVNYPTLAEQPCTPNIDALAAAGMRFTNAWSSPVCAPTRALLQTGRPAYRTGVGTNTSPELTNFNTGLQLEEPTLARLLPDYANAALGKWHLSDWFFDNNDIQHPIALGYHSYAGTEYGIGGAGYNDWTKTLYPAGVKIHHYNVYATLDTTDDALQRIASLPEPWLLYIGYNGAHEPLHCPLDQGYPAQPSPPGVCATDWCFDCSQLLSSPSYASYPPDVVQARAVGQALDLEIGRLLAAVDFSDTALILSSDNASTKRSVVPPFPIDHVKGTLYQGGVNVPLIVAVPGGLTGVCHELVQMTDMYSTVAELAGVALPPDPLRDSVSLVQHVAPWWTSPSSAPRPYAYAEAFAPNFVPDAAGSPPADYKAAFHDRTVRNGTHKLIEKCSWDATQATCVTSLELYELASEPPQDPALGPDPHEQVDLMLDPSSWSQTTSEAYAELLELLTFVYPRLPVGECP